MEVKVPDPLHSDKRIDFPVPLYPRFYIHGFKNSGSCRTVVLFTMENLRISGPALFKLVFFKGQLYVLAAFHEDYSYPKFIIIPLFELIPT